MTPRAGLACNVELDFGRTGWYGAIVEELSSKVRALPMWSRFTILRPDDGTAGPLTPERFDAIVGDVKNRSWYLDSGAGQEVSFRCFRDGSRLDLRLELFDDDFRRYACDLEAVMTALVSGFHRPIVRPSSGITLQFMPDLPYDRRLDLPDSGGMKFGQIADALDRRIPIERAETRAGKALARLFARPVPAGVRQVEAGDIVLYFWTDELTNPDALVRARHAHERWMIDRLASDLPPADRAPADRPLHASAQIQAPPLSFVDAERKLGFKTVLVMPDGSLDESSWAIAVDAARGNLTACSGLAGVYVIVPLREHAIALARRGREDGLLGVVYPADGDLWIPPLISSATSETR